MEKLIKRFEDIIDQEFIYTLEYPDTHDATLCAEEAKKIAIEFGKWISNNPLDFQTASNKRFIGLDMKYYTSEELFTKFIEEYEG